MLDFVPNHTATDHALLTESPHAYIRGTEDDIARHPEAFYRTRGGLIVAHGRDPYFAPWQDTAQIDYAPSPRPRGHAGPAPDHRRPVRRRALRHGDAAAARTSSSAPGATGSGTEWIRESFWTEAIPAVRERHPDFVFMAEAYWDLEWELQQQGFDFTYDKTLYDRLHGGDAPGVRAHLGAEPAVPGPRRALPREPRRAARGRRLRRARRRSDPRSSRRSLPACACCTKASSRDGGSSCPCSSAAGRTSRSTRRCARSTRGCWPCCAIPPSATARFVPLDVRPAAESDRTWDDVVAFAWREDEADGAPCLVVVVNLRAAARLGAHSARPRGLRGRPHLPPARSPRRRHLPAPGRRAVRARALRRPSGRVRAICSRSRRTDARR